MFGSLRTAVALVLHFLSLVSILAIFCSPEYSWFGFLIENGSTIVCKVLVYYNDFPATTTSLAELNF